MKTLFSLFIALTCATSIFAYDCKIQGIYYNINESDKTATVTYKEYLKSTYSGSIVIPNAITYHKQSYSVTTIGDRTFSGCKILTTITIPNSVTTIGEYAFFGCEGLTSVDIPNSVTTIGRSAFDDCSGLNSVTIPNSVTTIGESAFFGCEGLTSVDIPNSVTTIGRSAFDGCSSLTSVTIPNSVTTIGNRTFSGCKSLTSITIPNSVTTIGECAFSGCEGLTSVDIPNSVTTIEYGVFWGCKGLTSVTIPNSVTTIRTWAFVWCEGLTSITIPNSVTTIENQAFAYCYSLTSVIIPNSVTTIGSAAFCECSELKKMIVCSKNIKIDAPLGQYSEYYRTILYCHYLADLSNAGISKSKVHRLSDEELAAMSSFLDYAQVYIEPRINRWQQKDEYERTSEWQARVTEANRQKQISLLLDSAITDYNALSKKYDFIKPLKLILGKYDADNEVYRIYNENLGDAYIHVDYDDARSFREQWENKDIKCQYQIIGKQVVIQSMAITMPDKKQYTYDNNGSYVYYDTDFLHFDPIEIDLTQSGTSPKVTHRSTIDTDIPTTDAHNDKTFVVIVSNEKYESVASVPFASNDGRIFREYCHKTLGIPEQNIHLRENATLNNMRSELGWLKQVCDAYNGEASVIFYYAGHGIPDENDKSAYLLPTDGDGRYVQSGYKLDDLYSRLGSLSAKNVTVFMDACFSGSQRGSGMLAAARGIALKSKAGVPQGNMVVFSAAQGDETAYPNNDEGHGMFTYYLLKKLQETKGNVTLKDLGDYITTNVRQQSIVLNSKSQTPCVTPSHAVVDSWKNWKLK